MSDTGRVIANIIQMDESVIKLREAASNVEGATAAVERENSYLTQDRYQSPAAEVYRANYANATTKLLSTKDNLYTFAKNLQTSREMIAQAAGVTDQQIVDQKIRISQLNENIEDVQSKIDDLEQRIEIEKENIAPGTWQSIAIAGGGAAAVGGLATCAETLGIGCIVAGIGGFVAFIAGLGTSVEDAQTAANHIKDYQSQLADEMRKINQYQADLLELGGKFNTPPLCYYVPE